MDKIYLEQVLEQFVDKANVIIQTRDTDYGRPYCLGNHYAARWRFVLDKEFAPRLFGVLEITPEIKGNTLMWVITIDRTRDKLTDQLSSLPNCFIRGLDFGQEPELRTFKYRYTLRNGQTGSGVILAPNLDEVGKLARDRFNLHEDVRIYEVEEVLNESADTVGGAAEAGCVS